MGWEQEEIIAHWIRNGDKQYFPYIYAQRRTPLRLPIDSLRIKIPIDIVQGAQISSVINSTRGALNLAGIN